ncbi:MAG: bifunctional UDP-N-acetylglucosamine diphosphorylase/glucosamine-1-phosphate N-acetyltransferase GlmU [Devosia sp.]|nr:bifunctional UDP-N-acetylglucosamine diphosphorylase/glucosamine-1-phosphate N-acetyltransferase GlmU [Devosia sp.]
MTELLSIILAAGEGTRMRSSTPKVLHPVGGLPMVSHVIRAAQAAGSSSLAVVVGPNHEKVEAAVLALAPDAAISRQAQRLGTGHAVREARTSFETARGNVVVLYADGPMVRPETIRDIADTLDAGADIVVVGFEPADPLLYGRLLTAGGRLVAIREYRDATEEERKVRLCNSGIMGFRAEALRRVIDRIGNSNAKGEYYLTDAVELANADGMRVEHTVADADEVLGIDDRIRLAHAEDLFQELRREDFLKAGVTLRDPQTVYFSYDTEIARDVTIEPNVFFGPGVKVEEGVTIRAFSHIEGAIIGTGATIGPFARLRPEAVIAAGAHIGNFVEIKKAEIGKGAKINHLTYIGDATVGAGTNVGAGTITCNYDGINKHRTVIGENAFIGSNSSLVAPVTISDGAYIASGSVITEDVEVDALAFGRARQVNKPGYAKTVRDIALSLKQSKTK